MRECFVEPTGVGVVNYVSYARCRVRTPSNGSVREKVLEKNVRYRRAYSGGVIVY